MQEKLTMTIKKLIYGDKTKIALIALFITMGVITVFIMLPSEKATATVAGDNMGFTPTETYELIQSGEVVCIDVRTPMEYRSGHVEGCKLLPIASADFTDNVKALDPDQTYIFICRTQNRSTKAAATARRVGIKNSYISYGGVSAWRESALPLVKYK